VEEMSEYDKIFAQAMGSSKGDPRYDAAMPKDIMQGSVMNDDTVGMSDMELFKVGMGKRLTDRWLGLKQVFGLANSQDAKNKEAQDVYLNKRPMANLGGMVGDTALAFGMPIKNVKGAAMTGLGLGMTEPVTEQGRGEGYPNLLAQKFQNATLQAALSGGIQGTMERLIAGATAKTAEQKAAREFAQKINTPMTAGQMTAEPATKTISFAQRLEKQAAGMPSTKGYFDSVGEKQNQAVKDFIENKLYGQGYDAWGAGKSVNFDPQFRGQVGSIRGNYDMLPNAPQAVSEVEKQASLLLKQRQLPAVGQKEDFNSAQGMRRMYNAKSNPTGGQTTSPEDKAVYESFVRALDDAIERSVPGYKDVRGTYTIQKALEPARVTNPNGESYFDITKAGQAIRNMDKKNPAILNGLGARGEELRNLANFTEHAKIANTSGTAENILAQNLMLNPWMTNTILGGGGAAAGGIYGYSQGQDPLQSAAAGGLTALAAPILANSILQTGVKGLMPNAAQKMSVNYPFITELLQRARVAPSYGLLGN
jgi:hypothetical protein